jgi:hypothetical protein
MLDTMVIARRISNPALNLNERIGDLASTDTTIHMVQLLEKWF